MAYIDAPATAAAAVANPSSSVTCAATASPSDAVISVALPIRNRFRYSDEHGTYIAANSSQQALTTSATIAAVRHPANVSGRVPSSMPHTNDSDSSTPKKYCRGTRGGHVTLSDASCR